MLRPYLAADRKLACTSELEAYTGGSLVGGWATSVGQVLKKGPDKNGRLTRQVI